MIFWIVVAVIVVLMFAGSNTLSEDCSIDTHRRYGQWRVLYPDGNVSQPFMRKTAESYARMFNGRVVSK